MTLSKADISKVFTEHLKWTGDLIVAKINRGSMAFTYEVCAKESFYIFKAYPFSRYGVAKKEFDILKKAGSFSAKMPRAIAHGGIDEFSYLIYEKIPGESLKFDSLSDENKLVITEQIANNLQQISKIKFESFGSITEDEPAYNSWENFLVKNIDSGLEDLKRYDVNNQLPIKLIEKYMFEFLNAYNKNLYGMVWSDFSEENIIISNSQLSGFVDFEGSFYGDPLLSLGYLYAKEGDSVFFKSIEMRMQSFMDVKDSGVYFYALLRLLRISKHLSEPLPNGQQRMPVLNYFKGLNEILKSNQNLKIKN